MLQKIREHLALALLALLPFHALLVTVGTKMIAGAGNSPLSYLAIWKEGVLAVILGLSVVEIVLSKKWKVESGKWKEQLDVLDWLIASLFVLSLIVLHTQYSILNTQYLYGFKYDFIPLLLFVVLRRVDWSEWFKSSLQKTLITVGGIVSIYGIISLYMQQEFFVWLGYSDLHSLYRADGPLAAFQQIGGTGIRRLQSTMSGPNQLGLWLLIPLSILLSARVQKKALSTKQIVFGMFIFLAIALTFSRSAWIAAGVLLAIAFWHVFPRKKFLQCAGGLLVAAIAVLFIAHAVQPEVIARAASTKDHIARPLQAIQTIIQHPFGLSLGTAGPASNRFSDTCVHLPENADASWAENHPNLCVFLGDTQVQPAEPCTCPILPENWYLQMGVELGVLGLLLFVILTLKIIRNSKFEIRNSPAWLAFLGISIACLFLHAWEDSAVAYTVWLLLAATRGANLFEREQ